MVLLLLLLAVVLAGLAVAALAGRLPVPGVVPPVTTESVPPPAGPIGPEDLERVRFDLALRGYRMSQVDRLLDRVREELAERDAEIARLRAEGPARDPGTGPR